MTINGEADKKNEGRPPAQDEDILELKDKIEDEPIDDEDIIDLLDTADEPPVEDQEERVVSETTQPDEDEEILELSGEIPDSSENNEEIIDLMDAIEEISSEIDMKSSPPDFSVKADNEEDMVLEEEIQDELMGDEDIIDLLDMADKPPVQDQEEHVEIETEKLIEDEGIIELIDATGDTPQDIEEIGEPISETVDTSEASVDIFEIEGDLLDESIDVDDNLDREIAGDPALKDDVADSLGIEIAPEEDVSEDKIKADRISDEEIEAALERVVKRMFYEKIDGILVEVIEKTVSREIERLKRILLEEEPDNKK